MVAHRLFRHVELENVGLRACLLRRESAEVSLRRLGGGKLSAQVVFDAVDSAHRAVGGCGYLLIGHAGEHEGTHPYLSLGEIRSDAKHLPYIVFSGEKLQGIADTLCELLTAERLIEVSLYHKQLTIKPPYKSFNRQSLIV